MNIKNIICKCNLKQQYIASKFKVTQQAVSSWVRGRIQPPLEFVVMLADLSEYSEREIIDALLEAKYANRKNAS